MTPSELFCLTRTDLKNVRELRAGEVKAGLLCVLVNKPSFFAQTLFFWVEKRSTMCPGFPDCSSLDGQQPQRMGCLQSMVLWGCTCRGTGGMLAHLVCARFAVPMLHGIWPRSPCGHSPGTRGQWPPHHICVPLDPQKLHEEQCVTLQPAGPV